jgi:hypothetical protein
LLEFRNFKATKIIGMGSGNFVKLHTAVRTEPEDFATETLSLNLELQKKVVI